jgi:hypothetical protein
MLDLRAFLLLVLFLTALVSTNVQILAQASCYTAGEENGYDSRLASAGFFANFRNTPGSVNFEMDQMLSQAHSHADKIKSLPACPGQCPNASLALIFKSNPNKVQSAYSEQAQCQTLLDQTSKNPIVYRDLKFKTAEEAKAWYHELTQGEGPEGEDLYERCSGSCSPIYSTDVTHHDKNFILTATIICGHARDKDDDQYRLRSAFKWTCPKANL